MKRRTVLVASLLLLAYLIIRLINHAHIIAEFPLDFTNDLSSHIAKVVFLDRYGFHDVVPYWYNGYSLFKFYPPAWFYFTLPLYKLLGHPALATYLSLITIYMLGAGFLYLFGRTQNFSRIEMLFLFTFFFANPIAIGNFIKLGRLPELFAWLMFIPFTTIILRYRKWPQPYHLALLIPVYGIMLLAHQTTFIIASVLLGALFLTMKGHRIRLLTAGGATALVTSFWWFPFLRDIRETSILEPKFASRFFQFDLIAENVVNTLVILAFLITFYFYWRQTKSRQELLFYSPLLILAVLTIGRIIPFIPLFNILYPDVYSLFFLFFTLFFYLKTIYPHNWKYIAAFAPFVLTPILIITSAIITPWAVPHSELDNDILHILPLVTQSFVMIGNEESYGKAYYSYAPIYHNLSTPSGWSHNENSPAYLERYRDIGRAYHNRECSSLIQTMEELNTTDLIIIDACEPLCNLTLTAKRNRVCLFTV